MSTVLWIWLAMIPAFAAFNIALLNEQGQEIASLKGWILFAFITAMWPVLVIGATVEAIMGE